jgi:hypothetical protein
VQEVEPLVPAVVFHEKMPVLLVVAKVPVGMPSIVSVTVTAGPATEVVKPTLTHPAPVIAALKLFAKVAGVMLFT